MTQLPAAAQLTGEARTQVAQLITNFNELISAPVDWKVSYTKVSANLSSLLGADTASAPGMTDASSATPAASTPGAAPSAATPSASTAAAPGTAGAVGTSGTAAASAPIDPAVRLKLIELRKHLAEFEQAAGGAAK
ncbi:MAG: hypothetical protein ABJC51_06890 [Acidobacteriota bacterium]